MERFLNRVSYLRVDMLHCIEFIIMIVNIIWSFILTQDWKQALFISILIWGIFEELVLIGFNLLIRIASTEDTKLRLTKKKNKYFNFICPLN